MSAWWAWEHGHIPGNPRAISAAAMQPALLRHLITAPRGQQGGCLAPNLGYPSPELQGQQVWFAAYNEGRRAALQVV